MEFIASERGKNIDGKKMISKHADNRSRDARRTAPGKIIPELKLLKNSTLILNDLQLINQNP